MSTRMKTPREPEVGLAAAILITIILLLLLLHYFSN